MVDNNVIFFDKSVFLTINREDINLLKNYALESLTKRARYCLHGSCQDDIQEMIIAFRKDSYVRPHKHLNKTESFHVIEGELIVCLFDDVGNIIEKIILGSFGKSNAFYYRLAYDKWHCVVPISDFVVIHEVTKGPYNLEDTLFPFWSFEDKEKEKINNFLNEIKKMS